MSRMAKFPVSRRRQLERARYQLGLALWRYPTGNPAVPVVDFGRRGATMTPPQVTDLETELRYFNEHRAELLESAAGKFVLIKGESVVGTFDTETAAIRKGYEDLGNVSFLVKQITQTDI